MPAEETTFVLADIGGYTKFLTGVGLEHAREITSDLLNGLLRANGKRWQVAKLEGDCVFFYREGRLQAGTDIDAPADLVWRIASDHERQARWDSTLERITLAPGRSQKEWGAVHTCFHRGTGATVHVVVARDDEARKHTDRLFPPTSLAKDIYVTIHVEPLDDARSRVSFLLTFKEAKPVLSHVLGWPIKLTIQRTFRRALQDLKQFCELEYRQSLAGPPKEP